MMLLELIDPRVYDFKLGVKHRRNVVIYRSLLGVHPEATAPWIPSYIGYDKTIGHPRPATFQDIPLQNLAYRPKEMTHRGLAKEVADETLSSTDDTVVRTEKYVYGLLDNEGH